MNNTEQIEYHTCAKCGDHYSLDPEFEPTKFCNLCAQTLLQEILKIVPDRWTQCSDKESQLVLRKIKRELYE